MSWLFSQALVEAYSEGISSDGELSAPLNSTPTPQAFCAPDKIKVFSRLSRFGMMFAPLTANLGADILTWFREDSLARTFQSPAEARVLMGMKASSGTKWPESLARFDPATRSLKIHQHSLFEEGFESLQTLPRWGMIASGELYPLPTPSGLLAVRASITSETVSGLPPRVPTPTVGGGGKTLPEGTTPTGKRPDGTKATVSLEQFVNLFLVPRVPTPKASDAGRGSCPSEQARHSPNLETIVRRVPTPVASMSKGSSKAALTRKNGKSRANDRLDHNIMASDGGPLNPTWTEWLQGFPLEWTELGASGCPKFQQWCASHGKY